jgi:hypothetical protein
MKIGTTLLALPLAPTGCEFGSATALGCIGNSETNRQKAIAISLDFLIIKFTLKSIRA